MISAGEVIEVISFTSRKPGNDVKAQNVIELQVIAVVISLTFPLSIHYAQKGNRERFNPVSKKGDIGDLPGFRRISPPVPGIADAYNHSPIPHARLLVSSQKITHEIKHKPLLRDYWEEPGSLYYFRKNQFL
jgi:hypothetical protein